MEDMTTMTRADTEEIDLGAGHAFAPIHDQSDRLVGWLHTHPDARDASARSCQSFCAMRAGFGPDTHVVVQAEPLTLSPSLKCRICGAHGHVKNGQWESL